MYFYLATALEAGHAMAFDGTDCPLFFLVVREWYAAETCAQPFEMPEYRQPGP